MSTLARWCFGHRTVTIVSWVLLLVLLGVGSRVLGGASYADAFSLPGTQSTQALELLQKSVPAQAGDSDTIVWKVDSGTVRDPAVQQRIGAMLADVATLPHVTRVGSPYAEAGAGQISRDGRIAYAAVNFDGQANALPPAAVTKVIDTARAAGDSALQVELGGNAIKQVGQRPGGFSELIGIVAAAIVLFFAFGSLLSMLLPLLTAVVGIGTGIELVAVLSHAVSIASLAPTLSALIGLGVGIDYALFIVTRHRNGIKQGRSPQDAAITALDTSGRAVLFAGATVCIALLGLLVLGISFLNGVAIAAALTVLLTVAAAITLLPAMLGVLGTRALSRRERRTLAAGTVDVHAGSIWSRFAAGVQKRPQVLAGVAVIIMLVLAIPTLSLRLGSSDSSSDPASSTTRKAYDLLAEGFGPGFNGPLQIVAQPSGPAADPQLAARLDGALTATPGIAGVVQLPLPDAAITVFQVFPTTSPQSVQTSDLITHLRDTVLPPIEKASGARVYVGGATAIFADFAQVLTGKLPLFIFVIVALGALLLMLAFRSVLIPLTGAVMNLIAAAGAFGIVVAVFQFGWGSEALGLGRSGPVEAFLPVLMLAILFGLSMDYQVFLVSRMHEEWVHTHDNHRAVRVGQAETGKVITAAATIMIFVFLAFIFLGQRVIGEFGIGLASAVLLDAFVLRTILVPSLMHMVGNANWWLPGWLDRILPHLSVDPPESPAPAPPQDLASVGT